jgi:hypothetical protein
MNGRELEESTTGKIITGITMSLDGFVNDQNGSAANLYGDLAALHNTELL